jgi:hypothetical protein
LYSRRLAHERQPETRKKENVMKRLRSVAKRSPPPISNPQRRRVFLLATAFVTRGMDPDEAYRHAVYYAHGQGRGRTWISALTAHDRGMGSQSDGSNRGSAYERYGAADLLAALRVE